MRQWFVAAFASLVLATAAGAAEPVPGWLVEGAGREGDAKAAPYLGREALWLRNSTHAVRKDLTFTDGTIEFDLAPLEEFDFVAVTFRRQSVSQHENIYLRTGRSGEFMAVQYAPRLGSSTWQLYPEFLATVDWPRGAWTHVRVEVSGSRLQVFVGDAKTPTLSVPRLRHGLASGGVSIWSRVNNKPQVWSAAISNFQVKAAPTAGAPVAAQPPVEPFIQRWSVAGPFPESAAAAPPAGSPWRDWRARSSAW